MKKKYIVVSFMSTRFNLLKEHWEKYNNLKKLGVFGSNLPKPPNLGGKIIIIEWETKEIVWEFSTDVPTGIMCHENKLLFNNLQREINLVDSTQLITFSMKKNIFNNLHSISKTTTGYLITCTGLDLILEINLSGDIIWSWWASENGFGITPLGEIRKITRSEEYYSVNYPTLSQTTHVNSAIESYGKILATLFHQGIVVSIDKKSLKSSILCKNLSKPHSIRKISKERYIVSDTQNNQAKIFDINFKLLNTIKSNFSWVQTTIELENGNFLIADANNCRIVECSLVENRKVDEFGFENDLRIFDLLELNEKNFKDFIKNK